jgi:hypothetical protein
MKKKMTREYQSTTPSFPSVIQEELPNSKNDSKNGIHFNLTQISLDVDVNKFGFSLDY